MQLIIKIGFYIWVVWYRVIQRIQIEEAETLRYITNMKVAQIHRYSNTVFQFWKTLCKDFNLEWRKDPWWQLTDAVNLPEITLKEGGGDCDDFAFLSSHYITSLYGGGFSCDIDGVSRFFVSQDMWSIKSRYGLFGGHLISVWRSDDSFIITSNDDIEYFATIDDLKEYFRKYFFEPYWIIRYDNNFRLHSISHF